eukprot:m51a1_g14829 hypothetical protein (419) ;mRNA; r:684052-685308
MAEPRMKSDPTEAAHVTGESSLLDQISKLLDEKLAPLKMEVMWVKMEAMRLRESMGRKSEQQTRSLVEAMFGKEYAQEYMIKTLYDLATLSMLPALEKPAKEDCPLQKVTAAFSNARILSLELIQFVDEFATWFFTKYCPLLSQLCDEAIAEKKRGDTAGSTSTEEDLSGEKKEKGAGEATEKALTKRQRASLRTLEERRKALSTEPRRMADTDAVTALCSAACAVLSREEAPSRLFAVEGSSNTGTRKRDEVLQVFEGLALYSQQAAAQLAAASSPHKAAKAKAKLLEESGGLGISIASWIAFEKTRFHREVEIDVRGRCRVMVRKDDAIVSVDLGEIKTEVEGAKAHGKRQLGMRARLVEWAIVTAYSRPKFEGQPLRQVTVHSFCNLFVPRDGVRGTVTELESTDGKTSFTLHVL